MCISILNNVCVKLSYGNPLKLCRLIFVTNMTVDYIAMSCYVYEISPFPGPTSQTIGKAGGGPGTFWHVTDVKLRGHRCGFPLAKRYTNARLRDRPQKSERRRVLARGRYKSVLVLVPAPG